MCIAIDAPLLTLYELSWRREFRLLRPNVSVAAFGHFMCDDSPRLRIPFDPSPGPGIEVLNTSPDGSSSGGASSPPLEEFRPLIDGYGDRSPNEIMSILCGSNVMSQSSGDLLQMSFPARLKSCHRKARTLRQLIPCKES